VEDCRVDHDKAGECFIQPVEAMDLVGSGKYGLAFSNFVLEHVKDVPGAAGEIFRVLEKGGSFIFTVPNPQAPEFRLSRMTDLRLHKKIKGTEKCWPAYYSYGSIGNLVRLFEAAGFETEEVRYFPAVFTYLYRYPVLDLFARAYDSLISMMDSETLQGHVCLVFKKI
jgi:SAM-dependent methyltransferase